MIFLNTTVFIVWNENLATDIYCIYGLVFSLFLNIVVSLDLYSTEVVLYVCNIIHKCHTLQNAAAIAMESMYCIGYWLHRLNKPIWFNYLQNDSADKASPKDQKANQYWMFFSHHLLLHIWKWQICGSKHINVKHFSLLSNHLDVMCFHNQVVRRTKLSTHDSI